MNAKLFTVVAFSFVFLSGIGSTQELTPDVAYVEEGHERQVLDIYTSETATDGRLPVMFWIHGRRGRMPSSSASSERMRAI